MPAAPDPDIDQRRAADPKASAWVAASAGSGKTKVLVDRVLNLLMAGTAPERILCLTFTNAAAAEMANRIAIRLGDWATADDADLARDLARLAGQTPEPETAERARRLFARVLDVPGGMRIQTIHAFCQSLLRRFPLEAGVAPHFAVMEERDAANAIAAARDAVLAGARDGAVAGLAEALAVLTATVHETRFPDLIAEIARQRGRLRRMLDRRGGFAGLIEAVRAGLALAPGETVAGLTAEACARCDAKSLRAAAQALLAGGKTDRERGEIVAAWLAAPAGRVAGFDTYGAAFLTDAETVRKTLITNPAEARAPGARAALADEAERLLAARARIRAATVAEATGALLTLAAALLAAYQRHKEARALLDYEDLILAARRLLEADGMAAWALYKLDGGIEHVLIDEAQDTSPDQWAVVRALTGEFFAGEGRRDDTGRTIFAVGDRKQSIYSFQGAAPEAFEAMRAHYAERVTAAGGRFADVPLNVSFRSTRAVLDAVDAVFARDPGRDGVALDGENIRHLDFRQGQAGLVEVWPLLERRPLDPPPPWKPPVEKVEADSPETRLAGLIARRIHAMVAGGEPLESRGRAIRPEDILVLVRRRRGIVEDLVRALKGLGVPVAGVDRMVLTEQMAVMDLTALGEVLLLPEDDLTLATVLKGPLVGLSEEALFDLAHPRERGLWAALRAHEGAADAYGRAFDLLSGLMRLADLLPPYGLYAHILGRLGGRQRLVARLGLDAEDAIDEFLALALRYEALHPPSLQGFLRWLSTGAVTIKRDLDQGASAVRVMTVHGAKGLQAPIVFLPDTVAPPLRQDALLWQGEGADSLVFWPPRRAAEDAVCAALRSQAEAADAREYRRLLYVAMTRAADRLYVCGWAGRGAPAPDCWYSLVRDAVAPLAEEALDPFLAADAEAPSGQVLRLKGRQTAPPDTRMDHLPDEGLPLPLPDWATSMPGPEPEPPRPLAPSRPDGVEPPVRSPFGVDGMARFRRGLLIHRLLQSLPELAVAERAAACARFLDHAAADLAPEERRDLAAEALAVLAHPDAQGLFGPGSLAEVPVVGMVGGRVVAGQVDRLAFMPDAVLIADYKTNRPPPATEAGIPPLYLRQMAAYRAVLAALYPGRRVSCVLVWTDGPRVMALSPESLDAQALENV